MKYSSQSTTIMFYPLLLCAVCVVRIVFYYRSPFFLIIQFIIFLNIIFISPREGTKYKYKHNIDRHFFTLITPPTRSQSQSKRDPSWKHTNLIVLGLVALLLLFLFLFFFFFSSSSKNNGRLLRLAHYYSLYTRMPLNGYFLWEPHLNISKHFFPILSSE